MVSLENIYVLTYIIIGYATGIATLMFGDESFWSRSFGTTLIAHTITWSAYIHHDLCHNTVFESTQWNIRFGSILDWINGACYWTFYELKKQHINHHIYKVDYDVASPILKWVKENVFAKQLLCLCEYFYFPLHAYIVHWRSIMSPWWKDERKNMRKRTFFVILLRILYFSSFYYFGGLSVILCYLVAYSISIQVTRFTDAFSHDYEVVPVGSRRIHLSKQYDMLHTYSVVWETNEKTPKIIQYAAQFIHIAFFLNFNYHNQHHYATQKKWFQLGSSFQLDDNATIKTKADENTEKKIVNENHNIDEFIMNHQPEENETMTISHHMDALCGVPKHHFTIPMAMALQTFHKHRVTRLFLPAGKPIFNPTTGKLCLSACYGVADASLLALEV